MEDYVPVCMILVGLPCSGKSTLTATCKVVDSVASSDDWIDIIALTAGITYNEAWELYRHQAEELFWMDVDNFAKSGVQFIVDRTNLTKSSRMRIINRIIQINPDYKFITVNWEPTDERLALIHVRNQKRPGKVIPTETIEQMRKNHSNPRNDDFPYALNIDFEEWMNEYA